MKLWKDYNPIATHSLCFLIGVSIMGYSKEEPKESSNLLKKGYLRINLSKKKIKIPNNFQNSSFFLGKATNQGEFCIVERSPLVIGENFSSKRKYILDIPFNKNSPNIIKTLLSRNKLLFIDKNSRVDIPDCTKKNRVIYGS